MKKLDQRLLKTDFNDSNHMFTKISDFEKGKKNCL